MGWDQRYGSLRHHGKTMHGDSQWGIPIAKSFPARNPRQPPGAPWKGAEMARRASPGFDPDFSNGRGTGFQPDSPRGMATAGTRYRGLTNFRIEILEWIECGNSRGQKQNQCPLFHTRKFATWCHFINLFRLISDCTPCVVPGRKDVSLPNPSSRRTPFRFSKICDFVRRCNGFADRVRPICHSERRRKAPIKTWSLPVLSLPK